jgi:hypothetical protein
LGKRFAELSEKLRDRFEDGPLTFYLIDPQVPESVRLDIFERVNSGVALTRQQMRNALYNGPSTRLLRDLAKNKLFKQATGGSLSVERRQKTMNDREAVNRFLAYFNLGWDKFGPSGLGDFDEFLGKVLHRLNEQGQTSNLQRSKRAFLRSMETNIRVFGKHAFRKHESPDARRSALNLALFDAFSVGLARYEPDKVTTEHEVKLRKGFYGLLKKEEFMNAISYATARAENVHARFRMTEQMLERVLGAA